MSVELTSQNLYNGLAEALCSNEVTQSTGDGTLYYVGTFGPPEEERFFRLDDYHNGLLRRPPARAIADRQRALQEGMAWLSLNEIDSPSLKDGTLIGPSYNIVDPANIGGEEGGLMLKFLRQLFDDKVKPRELLIYTTRPPEVIQDVGSKAFLRGVFSAVSHRLSS